MRSADRCRRARREGHYVVTVCRMLVSAPTPLLTVMIEGAVEAHIPPLEPRCGWLPRVVRLTWSAAASARGGRAAVEADDTGRTVRQRGRDLSWYRDATPW
jgi:hypothetical protein